MSAVGARSCSNVGWLIVTAKVRDIGTLSFRIGFRETRIVLHQICLLLLNWSFEEVLVLRVVVAIWHLFGLSPSLQTSLDQGARLRLTASCGWRLERLCRFLNPA